MSSEIKAPPNAQAERREEAENSLSTSPCGASLEVDAGSNPGAGIKAWAVILDEWDYDKSIDAGSDVYTKNTYFFSSREEAQALIDSAPDVRSISDPIELVPKQEYVITVEMLQRAKSKIFYDWADLVKAGANLGKYTGKIELCTELIAYLHGEWAPCTPPEEE